MKGVSSSFNFNFAERDVQLLNEMEFHNSEESEDFSDYNYDAKEYIKAQTELEQEIIVSDENDDYQDDIEDTEILASPSPSSPSPLLPSLISTNILPSPILIGISLPSIPTKTSPPIPIEKQISIWQININAAIEFETD
ncbi:2291_t:CDS:2 [Funneliformis caledonium]|uniref:2291_t:CDS:1 n=1 Tax=Funneliformis caledonium TaxID=1117310 RepID=A0A9N9BP57_9GLOM|nr:2291_t:CDS:2 [Funneliformis caledonium]